MKVLVIDTALGLCTAGVYDVGPQGVRRLGQRSEAMARGHRYPTQAKDVNFMPCGQVIGRLDKVRRSADVIMEMVEEFVESMERGAALLQVEADA